MPTSSNVASKCLLYYSQHITLKYCSSIKQPCLVSISTREVTQIIDLICCATLPFSKTQSRISPRRRRLCGAISPCAAFLSWLFPRVAYICLQTQTLLHLLADYADSYTWTFSSYPLSLLQHGTGVDHRQRPPSPVTCVHSEIYRNQNKEAASTSTVNDTALRLQSTDRHNCCCVFIPPYALCRRLQVKQDKADRRGGDTSENK